MANAGSDDDTGPFMKKKKVYCYFKSAWKSQEFSVNVGGEEKTVSGTILSGVEGADNAKCTACGVTFSVHHGGANDVVKHFSTKGHWQAVTAKSSSSTLARYGFGHSKEALKVRRKMSNRCRYNEQKLCLYSLLQSITCHFEQETTSVS